MGKKRELSENRQKRKEAVLVINAVLLVISSRWLLDLGEGGYKCWLKLRSPTRASVYVGMDF